MLGPRFHIPLGGGAFARPGVAYGFGVDKPMAPAVANYHIIQVDLPIVF